jgi:hypothetical protein
VLVLVLAIEALEFDCEDENDEEYERLARLLTGAPPAPHRHLTVVPLIGY